MLNLVLFLQNPSSCVFLSTVRCLTSICRGSPGIVANQPRTHPYWRPVVGSTDGSGAGFALSPSCAVALCCVFLHCGVLNQRRQGFHSRCLQDCCLNRPPAHRVQGDAPGLGIGRSSQKSWKRRACGRRSPAKLGALLHTYGAGVRVDKCYIPVRLCRRSVPKSTCAEGGHLSERVRIRVSKG